MILGKSLELSEAQFLHLQKHEIGLISQVIFKALMTCHSFLSMLLFAIVLILMNDPKSQKRILLWLPSESH